MCFFRSSSDPRVTIDIKDWILVHRDEIYLLGLDFRFLPLSLWTLGSISPSMATEGEEDAETEEQARLKDEITVELDTGNGGVSQLRKQMVSSSTQG